MQDVQRQTAGQNLAARPEKPEYAAAPQAAAPVRATVIIPTFGPASFARWAIQSVQTQTVRELEICIICDGSPPEQIEIFRQMAVEDPRIAVFSYPKSPRTGEPYRDAVIRATSGPVICYCCHDDLWLPDHVETIAQALDRVAFTHTIHAAINTPEEMARSRQLFAALYLDDLADPATLGRLQAQQNSFGLSFAAHTRAAYGELSEGWVTTPDRQIPTDLYMWQKLAGRLTGRMATTYRVTALCFPAALRRGWSEARRCDEIAAYTAKIRAPGFGQELNQGLLELARHREHLLRHQVDCLEENVRTAVSQLTDLERLRDEHQALTARLEVLSAQLVAAQHALTDLAGQRDSLTVSQTSLKYLLRQIGREIGRRFRR
jgi:hypothetical protein